MLNKIKLYLKVCNEGEIFKRLEYKLKDITGYFYIRNKLMKVEHQYEIKLPVLQINKNEYKSEDKYYVYDKCINYSHIKEQLSFSDEFWRKYNISKYDDVKKVWEINRLQFLLPMALKYNNTKNEMYKDLIVDTLDYWIAKNKFEYSINWSNNLEVAVRSISLVMSLAILNDSELNKKYSQLIYLHAKYLYNEIDYSRSCIPNNHLIGEAVSLLILSNLLTTSERKKWNKKAVSILKKYKDIISDEGVSKENSFSYQFFVTKMYILALSFIEDKELFESINEKIIKSLEFLKYTIINESKVINYGDSDDAYYFSIEDKYNLSKDITRYYNYFFKHEMDEETQIVDELLKRSNKTIEHGVENDNKYFINKNIFIYKWNNNILFFNAKKIEGHAHNDSLGIVLVVNGEEILLDSGTYSYNMDIEKRKYYISREAHNTVLFEKVNVNHVGSFRWNNIFDSHITKVIQEDNNIEIEGIIEGICKRKVIIDKEVNVIDIYDTSLCEECSIRANWIVKNSKLKNDNIYTDEIVIKCEDCKFYDNKVCFSVKYMMEEEVNAFKTEDSKKINTRIELI